MAHFLFVSIQSDLIVSPPIKVHNASYTQDPYKAFSKVKRVLNNALAQNVSYWGPYCFGSKCATAQQTYWKLSGTFVCPQRAFGCNKLIWFAIQQGI